MFKKSFISIYFLPDRLLIAELSGNKERIKKCAVINLPSGTIDGYRLVDKSALTQRLKTAWSKSGLKEKAVGLILPEFSAFTKLLKIPKLDLSELSEAISWQAQEFLPKQTTEMNMDWKIVDKTEEGFEVLIVAIDKNILTEYVSSVEAAGLLPLVVETPSICLTRLTQNFEGANLILYKNLDETLLVVSEKKRIIGSSVTRNEEEDAIAKTAMKMLSHFRQVEIKNFFVGGSQISDVLIEKIVTFIKIKPQRLSLGVSDEKGLVQEYLIPLSLQLEEPAEPEDATSLNLLPSALVAKYRNERLKLQVWGLSLTVTLFVWISFFMTLGAYLLMLQQINDLTSQHTKASQTLKIQDQIKNDTSYINEVSSNILKIKEITFFPQKVLNDVYRVKSEKVTLNEYDIDLDTGKIGLAGIARDRVALIEFKQKLEEIGDFESVEIPISSFEKEADIEYQITFKYTPVVKTQPVKKPVGPTVKPEF